MDQYPEFLTTETKIWDQLSASRKNQVNKALKKE